MKMGRRLSCKRGIGHVSIEICTAHTASPAETALPAAHFDRNESRVIYGTEHWISPSDAEPLRPGNRRRWLLPSR